MQYIEIKYLRPEYYPDKLKYHSEGAAALDLRACTSQEVVIEPNKNIVIPSGIAIYIKDPNVAGIIIPRSGLGARKGLVIGNLVGLIDSDYQGEILLTLWNRSEQSHIISIGQRVAQMLFVPIIRPQFKEVISFSEGTERGASGFGSTGVN